MRWCAPAETDGLRILAAARQIIAEEPLARIDYVTLADADSLEEVGTVTGPTLLALAVHIGATRLIDNRILKAES